MRAPKLPGRRHLLADRLTGSGARLWVTLARFGAGYHPMARVSERPLTGFQNLWGYARDPGSRLLPGSQVFQLS